MTKNDTFITVCPQMRVVVMGLGRFGGGVGVSRWLSQQGCRVVVTDMEPASNLADSMAQLTGTDCEFALGGHDAALLRQADLLVVNPAVDKNKAEFVQAAIRRDIPITTEINLFVQRCCAPIVGITGSVGKSTTTAMICRALTACLADTPPRRCWMGGNIGHSLLTDIPNISAQDIVVLELSSFMLEDTPAIGWSPHVAVVTNVVPNHLDRHGTLADYAAVKKNILRFQTSADVAILNGDDAMVSTWLPHAPGRTKVYRVAQGEKLKLLVPGDHNQSNAQAALAVVEVLGFSDQRPAALAALQQFSGLPHRLQLVHTKVIRPGHTLCWYNDSKATTPAATLTALQAFPEKSFICIVGGYDKHLDLAELAAALATRSAGVLGIGATGPKIIELAAQTNLLPKNRLVYTQTLSAAVQQAQLWLTSPDPAFADIKNVVLSPGCASYDQFPNYEKRGEIFTALAQQQGQ
ncbi:MAG: UDP-N-acetylmuramoyl-L-alanine--D-glutamate ligase [Phycisphaerae bacterium]|nr:UDP-N-acetylmuramoyl-L-alanine--D-glutamate ligase [Phycisphaerae bacterium]